jgi:hypothetical protein
MSNQPEQQSQSTKPEQQSQSTKAESQSTKLPPPDLKKEYTRTYEYSENPKDHITIHTKIDK